MRIQNQKQNERKKTKKMGEDRVVLTLYNEKSKIPNDFAIYPCHTHPLTETDLKDMWVMYDSVKTGSWISKGVAKTVLFGDDVYQIKSSNVPCDVGYQARLRMVKVEETKAKEEEEEEFSIVDEKGDTEFWAKIDTLVEERVNAILQKLKPKVLNQNTTERNIAYQIIQLNFSNAMDDKFIYFGMTYTSAKNLIAFDFKGTNYELHGNGLWIICRIKCTRENHEILLNKVNSSGNVAFPVNGGGKEKYGKKK